MFSRTTCVFALAMALLPLASRAASDTELQELRKELDAMRANYEARLQQLESRLKCRALRKPSRHPPRRLRLQQWPSRRERRHRAPVRSTRRSR